MGLQHVSELGSWFCVTNVAANRNKPSHLKICKISGTVQATKTFKLEKNSS